MICDSAGDVRGCVLTYCILPDSCAQARASKVTMLEAHALDQAKV